MSILLFLWINAGSGTIYSDSVFRVVPMQSMVECETHLKQLQAKVPKLKGVCSEAPTLKM